MKPCCLYLLALALSEPLAAASIQMNWSTERELFAFAGPALSPGTAANGDGTLLELGYYTASTIGDPFAGAWRVLATSSIGDTNVNLPGRFSTSSILTAGTFAAPPVGTLLSIRFYDGLTASASRYFNAATDESGLWKWVDPGDTAPILNLQITKVDSVFQSGVVGAFYTEISTKVPEPATGANLAFSSVAAAFRRRRRS